MQSGLVLARLEDHGFLVIGAVLDQVLDLVLSDFNRVVVLQQLLLDGPAVDVRAVGAVLVLDVDILTDHLQHGVLPAHGEVVDHDVVVRTPAQGGLVLGELNFLDDDTVQRNNKFGHEQPLKLGVWDLVP